MTAMGAMTTAMAAMTTATALASAAGAAMAAAARAPEARHGPAKKSIARATRARDCGDAHEEHG